MSIDFQNNRIVIPIELEFDTSKLPQAESKFTSTKVSLGKGTPPGQEDNVDLSEEEIRSVRSLLQNPQGYFLGLGTKAIPFLGTIFASAEFAQWLINEMIKPGGPFDRRFKLIIQDQMNALRSPEHNWGVRIGEKQLIISTQPGHRGYGGVTNNLENIRKDPVRFFEYTGSEKALRLR